jgi:hypothetical protein
MGVVQYRKAGRRHDMTQPPSFACLQEEQEKNIHPHGEPKWRAKIDRRRFSGWWAKGSYTKNETGWRTDTAAVSRLEVRCSCDQQVSCWLAMKGVGVNCVCHLAGSYPQVARQIEGGRLTAGSGKQQGSTSLLRQLTARRKPASGRGSG